jgi:hypothetical protein
VAETAAKLTLRCGVTGGLTCFGGDGGGVGGEGPRSAGEEGMSLGLEGGTGLTVIGVLAGGGSGGWDGGRKGRCCCFLCDGVMDLSAPADVWRDGAGSEAEKGY